jgi:hypothetical protein
VVMLQLAVPGRSLESDVVRGVSMFGKMPPNRFQLLELVPLDSLRADCCRSWKARSVDE